MDAAALDRVYEVFQDFHDYCAPVFGRSSGGSVVGNTCKPCWCSPRSGANAENLSETVTASPRVLQRFLTEARWDDDAVIGRLQEYLCSRLEHPQAVWVLDGSDFPKQGVKSAGVARQYCGALGKIANCQAGVFLAQVGPGAGRWWTRGCICRRNGLGMGSVVRRRGVRRTGGSTKARRSWPWICWSVPRPEATSAHSGWWRFRFRDVADAAGGPGVCGNVLRFGRASGYDGVAAGTDLDRSPYQGNGRPRKPRPRREERQTMSRASTALPPDAWRELTIAAGSQGPRTYLFSAQRVPGNAPTQARRNPLAIYRQNRDGSEPPLLSIQRS